MDLAEQLRALGVSSLVVRTRPHDGECCYEAQQMIVAKDRYCQHINLKAKTLDALIENATLFYGAMHPTTNKEATHD